MVMDYVKKSCTVFDIQVLCNVVGSRESAFLEKSITEVYHSISFVLRGGQWGSNSQGKSVM